MDYIYKYLEENLSPKRLKHTQGVVKTAVMLAEIYGEDPNRAKLAAYCHDIAKCFSVEELNRYVREFGLPIRYINNQALSHSKIAACICEREFHISDKEILNSIAFHTTGHYGMSTLEEIVYVSDAIEENRSYEGVRRLRQQVKFDLDLTCLEIINCCIKNISYKGDYLDNDTLEAKAYIENKINKE